MYIKIKNLYYKYMKSSIVFFDNLNESANGTLRGLISLLTLLPIYYIISLINPKLFVFSNGTPFWLLAMSCGIGVIEPKSIKELLFFGSCVGLIMFSLHAFWSLDNLFSFTQLTNIVIQLLVGIIIACISSAIVWYIYWNNNYIRIPAKFNMHWQVVNFIIFICILYVTNYIVENKNS